MCVSYFVLFLSNLFLFFPLDVAGFIVRWSIDLFSSRSYEPDLTIILVVIHRIRLVSDGFRNFRMFEWE